MHEPAEEVRSFGGHLSGLQYYGALQLAHPRPWEQCHWAEHCKTLKVLHRCCLGVRAVQELPEDG